MTILKTAARETNRYYDNSVISAIMNYLQVQQNNNNRKSVTKESNLGTVYMRLTTSVFWTDPLYQFPCKIFVVFMEKIWRRRRAGQLAEISARETGIHYTGKTVLKLDSLSNK